MDKKYYYYFPSNLKLFRAINLIKPSVVVGRVASYRNKFYSDKLRWTLKNVNETKKFYMLWNLNNSMNLLYWHKIIDYFMEPHN